MITIFLNWMNASMILSDYSHCDKMKKVNKGRRTNKGELSKSVVLKLPYISETVSDEIRKFIRNRDLPVNVILKP